YILDMGEPLSIQDLAEQMIRFYGYTPKTEIPIEYIGLRPGEKLHENLWACDEQPMKTEYPRINRIPRDERFNGSLQRLIDSLRPICFFDAASPDLYRNRRSLRKLLNSHIPSVTVPENEPEY
ncbi:MAG TPA: polysaccharide biosynthesis protein, partial [Spirochaetia bacterium]|nr:polysaccharide biosynthesis protein [Spirochaetia bacterium]